MLARWLDHWNYLTLSPVSTWMGDRQGRPGAANLCPFVGVDLNLWPTVYIVVVVLTRTKINQSINQSIKSQSSRTVKARNGRKSPWNSVAILSGIWDIALSTSSSGLWPSSFISRFVVHCAVVTCHTSHHMSHVTSHRAPLHLRIYGAI